MVPQARSMRMPWVCLFVVVQLKPGVLQGLDGKGIGEFRVADGKILLSKTLLPVLYIRVAGIRLGGVTFLPHWFNAWTGYFYNRK